MSLTSLFIRRAPVAKIDRQPSMTITSLQIRVALLEDDEDRKIGIRKDRKMYLILPGIFSEDTSNICNGPQTICGIERREELRPHASNIQTDSNITTAKQSLQGSYILIASQHQSAQETIYFRRISIKSCHDAN